MQFYSIQSWSYNIFTSVLLKEDTLDQSYVLLWKHYTQSLGHQASKVYLKEDWPQEVFKKMLARVYWTSLSFLLSGIAELETCLFPKVHGRISTEAEHSVFGPYINPWQKAFHHARQHDLFDSVYISTKYPETRLESNSKVVFWTNGVAHTALLWRELLIEASLAVKRLNIQQTWPWQMGVGPLEELLLFLPLPHTPHSQMSGYHKTSQNTGSINSTQHGWDVTVKHGS